MTPGSIEALIDEHAAHASVLFGPDSSTELDTAETVALPPRQILVVNSVTHVAANFVRASGLDPEAAFYLELNGSPTGSSEVVRGYIQFAPADKLRAPTFNRGNLAIYLWMDIAHRPMVMEQLTHTNRYLWIGWFNGGQVYADLHTAP